MLGLERGKGQEARLRRFSFVCVPVCVCVSLCAGTHNTHATVQVWRAVLCGFWDQALIIRLTPLLSFYHLQLSRVHSWVVRISLLLEGW